MAIKCDDGAYSANFTDAAVPANTDITDGAAAGHTYVSIDVSCHGGAGDSQLVLTPMS